eukprot:3023043-Prymnesium_polylepis.1
MARRSCRGCPSQSGSTSTGWAGTSRATACGCSASTWSRRAPLPPHALARREAARAPPTTRFGVERPRLQST